MNENQSLEERISALPEVNGREELVSVLHELVQLFHDTARDLIAAEQRIKSLETVIHAATSKTAKTTKSD